MVNYLIYGKIIIDTVRLGDGEVHTDILGGGGPQALFGARLWSDSIGFLSRSGTDIKPQFLNALVRLDVDLDGLVQYPDLATVYGGMMSYDENEYDVEVKKRKGSIFASHNWVTMLARALPLPAHYEQPKAIHLITESFSYPMVQTALGLRKQDAVFSLEPIIDYKIWNDRDGLLALLPDVDIVTPDWPSASTLAESDDPQIVLAYWSKLGAAVVAIRHGRNGSYVWDRYTDEAWHVPIALVNAIDPTGAGNSYGAGFCVGWSETKSAVTAGCYGTVAASFVVESVGMPDAVTAQMQGAAAERVEELMGRVKSL